MLYILIATIINQFAKIDRLTFFLYIKRLKKSDFSF